MTIDIVAMRAKVRKPIGMTDLGDTDLSDPDIDVALNMSFWEVMDKFEFREKERIGTFTTVIGQRNYEMPSPFESITSFAIADLTTGQHYPLTMMMSDEYERLYNESDSYQAMPSRYVREACIARLWPTPDKEYVLTIRRNTILTDLSDTNPTLVIPQVWTEVIIYGAVWRIFIDFGDFARANAMKNHQVSLIRSITPVPEKELGDTARAGLEVLGRSYDQCDNLPSYNRGWRD